MLRPMGFHITGDVAADAVLDDSPFAVLVGMLLDQQYPMEHAFRGPAKILDRFHTLDPATIADADPGEFAAMCAATPAVHRYPASMATKIQAVARIVVDAHGGHAERIWTKATDGEDLVKRVEALPGFGRQKARIFAALVAKQLGAAPVGWQQAVGDYALDGYRSVADVVDTASLQQVRAYKQQQKTAAKSPVATS